MKEMIKRLVCRPEKVTFGMKEFLIWERDLDEKLTCRTIPYDTMVLAYPEAYDEKTGEMTAPEIQEITGSMKGNLIIWDRQRTMFRVELFDYEEDVGSIFMRLADQIPFAFLGSTPWMQIQDDQDFAEMLRMISLYKNLNPQCYD